MNRKTKWKEGSMGGKETGKEGKKSVWDWHVYMSDWDWHVYTDEYKIDA